MVTDKNGYMHLIEYLTEHLSLFENMPHSPNSISPSIIETIEEELGEQIINVCLQNSNLTFNQRNTIVREVDSILYDLEEILSTVVNNPISTEQLSFIKEFALLIKNLFDSEINSYNSQ
ncbi:DUF3802 family protein [Pseudocolwellia agarivorans]|uniref:DUF3802 family protein n=1 Tax=Pseudocolwellia agarivorans TaxID=1911682 RepID=UPI000984A8EE|nr:DUF3802 family protein [Pseudocolwellia agarivorans]